MGIEGHADAGRQRQLHDDRRRRRRWWRHDERTATAPPSWLAYVGVDDVRAKTAQAKSLGATVLQDVMEVGDFGTMSVIRDPTGATIAMWQSKPHG